MSRELIIPFESFKIRGIQKKVISDVEESFFYNIYMQAFQLIEQINKTNEARTECCDKKYDYLQYRLNDFQNVIAFTGRRGTGKTSSMLSFMDTLVSGNLNQNYFKKENFSFIDKGFFAIPYTDASMMSKNEDIFETVLSKMLSCIKSEYEKAKNSFDYRYSINNELCLKKVCGKICDIYNCYSSLKNSKEFSSSTPYNFMEKLADKHNVREQFVKIVDEFTSLLSDFNGMKINYLIICIDDIDMTQNKHMDIMQCIHQYFMIPGVIVFVSFNIPMLTATLQADFYSHVSIDNSRDEEHNHQMDMTLNQTYDFMRKIIPADMRINMPSWKKMITENFFLLILILKIRKELKNYFLELTNVNFIKKSKKTTKNLLRLKN